MEVDVIKIGNSKGLRLPKAVLKECDIGEKVDLKVDSKKIILSPVKDVRSGWLEKFEGGEKGELLLDGMENNFDEEWQW